MSDSSSPSGHSSISIQNFLSDLTKETAAHSTSLFWSVSSIRKKKIQLFCFACFQLTKAENRLPKCKYPVGEGAIRVHTQLRSGYLSSNF
jgi:hypothetical protein